MYQKQFHFFWPLTEQIELPLDFTESDNYKRNLTSSLFPNTVASNFMVSNGNGSWISSKDIPIPVTDEKGEEIGYINFTINRKYNIITKLAYKLLGIKWKSK